MICRAVLGRDVLFEFQLERLAIRRFEAFLVIVFLVDVFDGLAFLVDGLRDIALRELNFRAVFFRVVVLRVVALRVTGFLAATLRVVRFGVVAFLVVLLRGVAL